MYLVWLEGRYPPEIYTTCSRSAPLDSRGKRMKSYITIAQLKARLQPLTQTIYDADFLGLIQHTSDEIDHECHRYFECREGIKYAEGSGTTVVSPEDFLSLTAVDLDMDGDGTYETNLTPATDLIFYPLNEYPKTYMKTAQNCGYSFPSTRAGIRLTGVFGFGDLYTAAPYSLIGDTITDATGIIASATSFTPTTPALFSPGQTLRIESEQCFVTAVTTTVTITRGENGTTAASHAHSTPIYLYRYYGAVVEATMIQCIRWWKRRESAYQTKSGSAELGTLVVYHGLDDDVKRIVEHVKRHPI